MAGLFRGDFRGQKNAYIKFKGSVKYQLMKLTTDLTYIYKILSLSSHGQTKKIILWTAIRTFESKLVAFFKVVSRLQMLLTKLIDNFKSSVSDLFINQPKCFSLKTVYFKLESRHPLKAHSCLLKSK